MEKLNAENAIARIAAFRLSHPGCSIWGIDTDGFAIPASVLMMVLTADSVLPSDEQLRYDVAGMVTMGVKRADDAWQLRVRIFHPLPKVECHL